VAQIKRKVWAIVAASSVMSSTAFIGAAEREATLAPAQQAQFRASISQAIAAPSLTGAATQTPQASQDQDPPQGRRPRVSQGCSCGMPGWLKYSLIGVAAAGGGYALSQINHHEGGDGNRTMERGGR
jgi:hypothetical protein